jgi:colanic acid/amylovoran biosynthesis glycosyltransferase
VVGRRTLVKIPNPSTRSALAVTVPAASPVPPRVAHVVRRYGVTSQTFVPGVVAALEQLGWEGWVVTMARENGDWFRFPPVERVLLARRPGLAARVAGRALGRPAAERRARWLSPEVGRVAPSLVHAHFGWAGVDALPVARSLGLPLVVSFYGTDVTVYGRQNPGRREYRQLFAGVRHVTVPTRFLENRLRRLGYTGYAEVIPSGVHPHEIPFRVHPPEESETRLLFVGRHVPVKGLDVLLHALAQVSPVRPVRLDVVGDGPERKANEDLAANLGLSRSVRFVGERSHSEVLAFMRDAHLLVVPSRSMDDGQAEALGMVSVEAQAVGMPVVVTRCGGLPETVPPAYRHELVPEGDPAALANRLLAVLADRAGWEERARAGRGWVEQSFHAERLARRTSRLYEGALELPVAA